jgi:dipeptidyl aminopeptidase/acylaminoacyl peptidase
MMFTPTHLDESKIAGYPIINNAYPGPQTGSVGSRAWSAARGDRQALAELGFVVVSIDGRGTPGRSKSFHDAYYGRMGRDNTIPDQVAGMKDLAKQYPYIDIDRAAMWGHSGGGFITADALFRFPEFFKVGISESGEHAAHARVATRHCAGLNSLEHRSVQRSNWLQQPVHKYTVVVDSGPL